MPTKRDALKILVVAAIRRAVEEGLMPDILDAEQADAVSEFAATALDQIAPACLTKADVDEPVFVLRAQDATAEHTVRWWLHSNITEIPMQKIEAAVQVIVAMGKWSKKKQAD